MTDFNLNAVARDQQGKGASRRLRHANLVPAVIYGGEQAPQSISISFKDLVKVLRTMLDLPDWATKADILRELDDRMF